MLNRSCSQSNKDIFQLNTFQFLQSKDTKTDKPTKRERKTDSTSVPSNQSSAGNVSTVYMYQLYQFDSVISDRY